MKLSTKICSGILILSLQLMGCTYETVKPPDTVVTPMIDSCTSHVMYEQKIVPILNTNCAIPTCHVSTGFKDFSSYGAFRSIIEARGKNFILSRISPGGGMPPSYTTGPKSISACDYDKIKTWLENGYPNN